jgi:hypothetical protein
LVFDTPPAPAYLHGLHLVLATCAAADQHLLLLSVLLLLLLFNTVHKYSKPSPHLHDLHLVLAGHVDALHDAHQQHTHHVSIWQVLLREGGGAAAQHGTHGQHQEDGMC